MTEAVAGRVSQLVRAASTADASWYREEPALYLCPECGSFVGKGSNACPFCGVVFDEGESGVTVSGFGDGAEAALVSRGVLAGREAEVGGELAGGVEAGEVADLGEG